jgi:hypothetical protein
MAISAVGSAIISISRPVIALISVITGMTVCNSADKQQARSQDQTYDSLSFHSLTSFSFDFLISGYQKIAAKMRKNYE